MLLFVSLGKILGEFGILTLAEKEGLGSSHYVSKGLDPATFEKQFPRKPFKNKFIAFVYNTGVKIGLFEGE